MRTTNTLDLNNRISALEEAVDEISEAVDEISEAVVKQTAGTSITLNPQCILYHDSVDYCGFAMFPFVAKNNNYIIKINGASQDNAGDVTESITIGTKKIDGFRFKIPGTYDYKKCGVGLNYTITFA